MEVRFREFHGLTKTPREKNNQEAPSGSLSIWTPAYEGMNPLVQNKIDQILKDLIQRFEG